MATDPDSDPNDRVPNDNDPGDIGPDGLGPAWPAPPNAGPTGPRWEPPGDPQIPPALIALRRPLPDHLFVLYDPQMRCYCYRRLARSEDCGLLCFLDEPQAHAFTRAHLPPQTYGQVWQVSLDKAHEMARERHAIVNCLLLVEETLNVVVHYVR